MTKRATFSLENESAAFLELVGGRNKSAYINDLLKREKQKILKEALIQANQEEAEDAEYQEELTEWDTTLSDGLPK